MPTISHHIWIGFAGGLIAFAHCIGMCGGFVLHLSREKSRYRMLTAQLLWHMGKFFSYLFLGALAGFTGGYFQLIFVRHGLWQNLISYTAGAVMLMAGLSLLGLSPVRDKRQGNLLQNTLSSLLRRFFSTPSAGSALTLGMASGFLPCPIVLAFTAYAVHTGSVIDGLAVMSSLSLGTSLPLLMLGGAARLTRWHLRSWAPKAGGALLILFAVVTALRGTNFYHQLLGCPPKPVLQESSVSASPPSTGTMHGKCDGH